MSEEYKTLLKKAQELADFFEGTYAAETISNAVNTHDKELLRIILNEFQSHKQLIEQEEGKSEANS